MFSADDTPALSTPKFSVGDPSSPWFGQMEQRDFEIDFYQRILDRQPNDVRILRLLGEIYARQGRYDRALEIDQKLAELLPDEAIIHYNLACSLAMQNDPASGLAELSRALELGYNDFGQLEVDPDLQSIRQLPAFKALASKY